MKKILHAEIIDGELYFEEVEKYKEFLNKNNNKKLAITLDTNLIRSIKQNSYYWGFVIEIFSKEIGYEREDVHEILKREFLPKREIKTKREAFEVVKSTTDLSTVEFMNYIRKCRVLGGRMNIQIPLPPDDCEFKFKIKPSHQVATDDKNWHYLVCDHYDYECQVCHTFYNHQSYYDDNGVNQYLCGHHVKTKGSSPELRLRVDNGICVCLNCHNEIHKGNKKFQNN